MQTVRSKTLFGICDCRMHWQAEGSYLAIEVEKYTKTKKYTFSMLELFHTKERDIPVERLEMDNKNDKIFAFAEEPEGQRFVLLHGDSTRRDITFYSMDKTLIYKNATKLATLEKRKVHALHWSPAGRFIVFAGCNGFDDKVEFYDADECKRIAMVEHYRVSDVEWDPTGR